MYTGQKSCILNKMFKIVFKRIKSPFKYDFLFLCKGEDVMAKRRNGWTEEKIERYIKEGRGQGENSEYIPWLNIQNFPSNGNVSRHWGWKTKRQHEFLSNLERDYFFLLEWQDNVLDIREQFLLDREDTLKIAEEKGIKHSIDNTTNTYIPMTTDFFITLKKQNQLFYLARTIKPSKELEDPRVVEKFEIEREYWEQKGINWGIVTEKEISKKIAQNIAWAHKCFYLDDEEEQEYSIRLLRLINESSSEENLQKICDQFDENYNLETGSALKYLRYLIARKLLTVNMEERIIVSKLIKSNIEIHVSREDNIDYIIS